MKVYKLKESGMLDTVHSSGWRHLELGPDEEKPIIQLGNSRTKLRQNRPSSSESAEPEDTSNRMFLVAYILQSDPPGPQSYYLPERYRINRETVEVRPLESSTSDSYQTLHGDANSVQ